jgi:hypothetical protein
MVCRERPAYTSAYPFAITPTRRTSNEVQGHRRIEWGFLSVGEPCRTAECRPRSRQRSALDRFSGA